MPPRQQTRVAAFLISCHGAMVRQLTLALCWQIDPAWHAELNAQLFHEAAIVALLPRATFWPPDPELLLLPPNWETSWLPRPSEEFALAAAGNRRARPFALALRRIEFESGRVMQPQIMFLKSADLLPIRNAVNAAVEGRHLQLCKLWQEMLAEIGVDRCTPQ